ncbi:Uu.00g147010.m01.CDS01 [Anthostomella pinea]|uniref:Uu.00g147010.m01.CDS01 n=1 Tax=Anthostomella pinea TaxID=933095 RepID=A0AAI8VRD6_9PEZI|nr:Uu.00g147010.m01.CDS01 [Anthostomella pinea]
MSLGQRTASLTIDIARQDLHAADHSQPRKTDGLILAVAFLAARWRNWLVLGILDGERASVEAQRRTEARGEKEKDGRHVSLPPTQTKGVEDVVRG